MSTFASPVVQEALRGYNSAEMPFAEADAQAETSVRGRVTGIPEDLRRAPHIVICSIWPEPLESQPFAHGGMGRKIYSIGAGSVEKPAYATISTTSAMVIAQEGVGELGHNEKVIFASQIAEDIINHWAGDHPGNRRGKKGIGVIRGTKATPEELKKLADDQKHFLEYLVERAGEFYDLGKREKIGREHRRALEMLGLDINLHPWYRNRVQLYNDCPLCSEKVAIEAIFCKHCRNSIVDYFTDRGDIPDAAKWPRVVSEIERRTASKKKEQKNA